MSQDIPKRGEWGRHEADYAIRELLLLALKRTSDLPEG